MRSFAPATEDALAAGLVESRSLILFDFSTGLYGFWNGQGPFDYEGVTYIGAGSLISVSNIKQTSDLSAVRITLTLTAIPNTDLDPDTLATIELEGYHQRPVTIYTAYFSPADGSLLSIEVDYRGYVDRVLHSESDGGSATLEMDLESRSRVLQRTGYRMRSDTDQRRINAVDNFFQHTTAIQSTQILFGKVADQPPPPPPKKSFLQRLFG